MSKCLHNLSLGTCHLYIYVSLKWKIKFERKKNTRWDFTFLSIKQRKQIVNFIYYIWFQFYTYNISYSTREKFINLSWVGIQWNLVLYSKGSLCCNIWMHRFFFNILNNERYHLRVLKSQNIYLEGIQAWFKLLLLTNIFTYMPSFFFQMQSSCTFYTCMHFLLIISLVIALIPIFHANYTVHHIKKSMQSISWIFWLRIKGEVLKDLSEEQIVAWPWSDSTLITW